MISTTRQATKVTHLQFDGAKQGKRHKYDAVRKIADD